MHSGKRFMIPSVEIAIHLAGIRVQRRLHLLRVGLDRGAAPQGFSSSKRVSRLRMVRKLVSVPPSQRSLTKGMPQRRPAARSSPRPAACPHEQHRLPPMPPAASASAPAECSNRLPHVDNVDQIPPGVDVGPHLGIPAAGPVSEMHSRFNQVLHQNHSQSANPPQSTPAKSPPKG